jgi:phage-related protein
MHDPPFYTTTWLNFYAITDQARDSVTAWSDQRWTHFTVAATVLDTSIQSGRAPAGRAARIKGSKNGLFELRITPPGSPGPHVRVLYVTVGRNVLCVRVVVKRQARIPRHEINLADRAITDYRAARKPPK